MMPIALRETRFAAETHVVRRRLLPGSGVVLVHVGDRVQPDAVVAESPLDGQIQVVDLARTLGTSVSGALQCLRVVPGSRVEATTLLATRKPLGRKRRDVLAPFAGTVQTIEDGYLFLRQETQSFALRAYIPGQVLEEHPHRGVTIGVMGTLVRGIWGCGGECQGTLAVMVSAPDEPLTWERVGLRYRGAIIVGGILEDPRVLLRARQFRLLGLVVGSMAPQLRPLAQRLGVSVVVTEGIGRIPIAEPILERLRVCHGRLAVLCGSSEGGLSGPEIIVPLPGISPSRALAVVRPIHEGMAVRLTRPPFVGLIGEVVTVPLAPQETPIGTHAEGVMVRLPDGRRVFIPLVNLEPLG
jgi:hypothetical protein